MTVLDTIAKSVELDKLLASPLKESAMPEEIGGSKLVGELGGMFEDIRKVVANAKLGIAGAASELMTEVKDLKHIEAAIRVEARSVRDFKTKMLGNAVGGENQDPPPETETKIEGEKG